MPLSLSLSCALSLKQLKVKHSYVPCLSHSISCVLVVFVLVLYTPKAKEKTYLKDLAVLKTTKHYVLMRNL